MASVPYDESFNGIVSVAVVMFSLTTITLVLRLVARYKQKVNIGPDDILAVLAWFFSIGPFSACLYGVAAHVLGQSTPSDRQLVLAARGPLWQSLFATILTSTLLLGCARLSAIFFYRRVFHVGGKVDAFDIITKIMMVIISLWTVGYFLTTVLACGTNVPEVWSSTNTAVCAIYPDERGLTISSFLLDFMVLMLPVSKLWKLQITAGRKFAISLVFLLALAGTISGAVRAVQFYLATAHGAAANVTDAYRANTQAVFYALLEGGAVTTAINLPSIWYFAHGLTPKRVMRSFRSFVSLRSSNSSSHEEKTIYKQETDSSAARNGSVSTKRAHHELDI